MKRNETGLQGLRTPHVTAADLDHLYDSALGQDIVVDLRDRLAPVEAAFGWEYP